MIRGPYPTVSAPETKKRPPNDLEERLLASGVTRTIVDGYVMRWREVIERYGTRAAE